MEIPVNLKNAKWFKNGNIVYFRCIGYGLKNQNNELLSNDGIEPNVYSSKAKARKGVSENKYWIKIISF